ELVVFPPDNGEQLPRHGTELGISDIFSLTEEASRALASGARRAAFLMAWAAVEAAMREAARQEAIPLDTKVPSFVLQTLYVDGPISREDYDRAEQCLRVRNSLVH